MSGPREFWITVGAPFSGDTIADSPAQSMPGPTTHVIEFEAYAALKADNLELNLIRSSLISVVGDLNQQNKIMHSAYEALKNKYEELLSYIPKVPTEPYEKELARQNQLMREALEACCAPEPDGMGGFVADEFMGQAILDGRRVLAKCGSTRTNDQAGVKMTTKDAVTHLCHALKTDEGYWITWRANIALAFIDEYNRSSAEVTMHAMAEKAADNFLNLLCSQACSPGAEDKENKPVDLRIVSDADFQKATALNQGKIVIDENGIGKYVPYSSGTTAVTEREQEPIK